MFLINHFKEHYQGGMDLPSTVCLNRNCCLATYNQNDGENPGHWKTSGQMFSKDVWEVLYALAVKWTGPSPRGTKKQFIRETKELATGRQPVGFLEISFGKSHAKSRS